jgi:hypothetical protein
MNVDSCRRISGWIDFPAATKSRKLAGKDSGLGGRLNHGLSDEPRQRNLAGFLFARMLR